MTGNDALPAVLTTQNGGDDESEYEGTVYVLINEAMPGYVKIGRTKRPLEMRLKEFDRSGAIPLPFEVYYAKKVENSKFVEKQLHKAFSSDRVRKNREFFALDADQAVAALEIAHGYEVKISEEDVVDDKEDLDAINKAKSRRGNFNFHMLGIDPGAILTHKNAPEITCEVYDEKQVVYGGVVMSISKAAGLVLQNMGKSPQVAGTYYWLWNGKKLDDIRREMEEEG